MRDKTLVAAAGLYLLWTVATYLFEGRILTLVRPEAIEDRLYYALFVNLLLGVAVSGLILVRGVRRHGLSAAQFGFRAPQRTFLGIALGIGLGIGALILGEAPKARFVVLLNAFAQVWVVSVAEVLVYWVLLGKAIERAVTPHASRPIVLVVAWVAAAAAFGVYHFAHSPPFNTPSMVALLTVVGLATGALFFAMGELYGALVFHNFLALKGVSAALEAQDSIQHYSVVQWSLLLTACAATVLLLALDRSIRRSEYRVAARS